MSARQRLLVSVVALALIVVAFVALRPDDSSDTSSAPASTSTAPTPAAQPSPAVTREPPPPEPRPQYVQIRAKGLKPVGGVKELKASKGETVRIEVRSDQPDEAHLHGYDISKDVGPGMRARFRLTAKLEGIFELELEHAGEPIAELQVNP